MAKGDGRIGIVRYTIPRRIAASQAGENRQRLFVPPKAYPAIPRPKHYVPLSAPNRRS